MRIDVLTLFPEMFEGPLQASILGRAIEGGLVEVVLHNIRDYAEDKHHVVDDYPFGGGPGMVMKPEPLFAAVEAVSPLHAAKAHVVLLTPQGRLLTQAIGDELAKRNASSSSAVTTRASTNGSASTWSTTRSASATTCSPAAS